jgi:serine phosphatase RsbU (regulator of sigma subunit)
MRDLAQQEHSWSRDDRTTVIVGAVLLSLLYVARLHSYVLFHTVVELVFIIVCVTVLIMAWSLRQFLDDDFAVFLGLALCFVAALHLTHMVDYPGVNMISTSLDPPTQVWLGARFLLAASFVGAPFVIGRRLNVALLIAVYTAYCAVVLASIYWWHVFPATLLAGGLTPFKKIAEYVICLLFALAIVLLWRRRTRLPHQTWRLLTAALVVSIVAELLFTLYITVATWPNFLGHVFLVISALLIFRAVVNDGLARPHALAVRDLRQAELLHRRLEMGLMPSIPLEHEGLNVISRYRPGDHHLELGGDFIDVLDRGEAGVAVICGDVSGHGPNAAALGAMLRASWQALCTSGADPVTIVESLSAVLARERRDPNTYATFCLAWIDPHRDEVRLLNVGHPAPLLMAGDVKPLPMIPMPPLGTFDWPVEEPERISLPAGWQLFFYTDGLIEGRTAPGSQKRYGEERLVEALGKLKGHPVDGDMLERLIGMVEATGGERFTDDVTVILVSKTQDRGGIENGASADPPARPPSAPGRP